MITSKYHIICARLLLICFIAGQCMVYAHQHNVIKTLPAEGYSAKTIPHQTVAEKCYLCDVMHHNNMDVATQVYVCPVITSIYTYKTAHYGFTSIQLILSSGRAPPHSETGCC